MPGENDEDPVVKRNHAPEVVAVLEKLRRQAGVRERLHPVPLDRHQQEDDERYVRKHREQHLVEIVKSLQIEEG